MKTYIKPMVETFDLSASTVMTGSLEIDPDKSATIQRMPEDRLPGLDWEE